MQRLTRLSAILPFISFFIVGFLIYANILQGEFVFDDYRFIVYNPAVHSPLNLVNIWQSFNTRFLVGLSFALNYVLGGLTVTGYHAVNILFHIFNAILVFYLVLLTFQTPWGEKHFLKPHVSFISFFTALIFLAHPLQIQAVSFITQRFTTMGAFFYLLTIVFYLRGRISGKRKFLIWAFWAMVAGCFAKEFIVSVPFILLLYELYFLRVDKNNFRQQLKHLAPFSIIFMLMPLAKFFDRQEAVIGYKYILNTTRFDWHYLLTELNVLKTYLRILVLPVNLNADYDFPIAQNFWEPATFTSICLLSILAAAAIYLYNHQKREWSFFIAWFFVATSVEAASVVFGNREVIYEHWAYLATVSYAFAVSFLVYSIFKTRLSYARIILTLIVCLYSLVSYERNKVWQTEVSLWQDVIRQSPHKPQGYGALGKAYWRKGKNDLAFQYYMESLRINPRFHKVMNDIALYYFSYGKDSLAASYLLRMIELDPQDSKGYSNLAYIFYLHQQYKKAVEYYQKALQLQKHNPDVYFYLAKCYTGLKDFQSARSSFEKALPLYEKFGKAERVKEIRQAMESLGP